MSQVEEAIRNFCHKCMIKSKSILYCTKCGNTDLIPEPQTVKELPELYWFEPVIGQMSCRESNLSNVPQYKENYVDEVLGTPELETGVPILPEKSAGSVIINELKNEVEKLEPEDSTYKHSPLHFLTGEGGTGKTFLVRKRAAENLRYMELTSTTGIAAINLGGRTVHSTLKFFNTKSLRKNWEEGKLQKQLRKVRQNKSVLGIEECSMLSKEMFDIILAGIDEINNDNSGKQLGLHLIGDFAQLPPIPELSGGSKREPFCFESDQWNRFTVEKLMKVWRQDNPDFIQAIRYARHGDGQNCIVALLDAGVRFEDKIDNWFNGTTLIPKNDEVDFYNTKRLNQLNTPMLRSMRNYEGVPDNSWEKLIPIELRVKEGACVMILANDSPNFNYVNGDIGWIRGYDDKRDAFQVELKRTGATVSIGRIKRSHLSEYAPHPIETKNGFTPHVDLLTGDWIVGTVSYHPLRLAYASTIHKSQGLSLDLVQIDTNAWFFSHPGMAYVALSRCRTPEGLIIVGKPQNVAAKIKSAPEVAKWI